MLQQYISKHWSPVSTSFEQPVVPPEVCPADWGVSQVEKTLTLTGTAGQRPDTARRVPAALGSSAESPHGSGMSMTRDLSTSFLTPHIHYQTSHTITVCDMARLCRRETPLPEFAPSSSEPTDLVAGLRPLHARHL
jgi:hypothetical protein